MPDLLVEETNPYGTRRASLLAEDGNVYLYLSDVSAADGDAPDAPAPTVSAAWVANLGPAPDELVPGDPGEPGRPPIMGRDGTAFPHGCPPLEGPLELVWFEEGDGVALLDADGLLAVIPGWGGRNGFCGYARHCRDQTPIAWPLGQAARTRMEGKVAASRAFWVWRMCEGWEDVALSGQAHLVDRIGRRETWWRIDGGRFPEMIASRHRLGDRDVWITSTTGLSAQRMPQIEQFVEDAGTAGRIELAMARSIPDDAAREAVAGPASIPFRRMTWLGPGHIVDGQDHTSSSFGRDVAAVLLTADPPTGPAGGPPDLSGLERRGEPVNWLWLLTLDEATLAVARSLGSAAAIDALRAAGGTWVQ